MEPDTYFHVTREQLANLFSEKLPPKERQRIVRHLLTRCEPCLSLAQEYASGENEDYSGLLRRLELSYVVSRAELDEERVHAASLWPVLRGQSPERQLFLVKHHRAYQTWGLYELILKEIKTVAPSQPLKAIDLAHLALVVTELLDAEAYGHERISDFQAGAYTALGNTKRMVGDLKGAEAALRRAEELLREGTGDPLEKANFISIYASLRADLGFLEEATEILRRAIHLSQRIGDCRSEGRFTLQQSAFIGFINPALGLELAEKGLSLVLGSRDTYLELVGRHLIAFWTNELGDPQEAAGILATYRYLYASFNDVFWTGRLLHLQGNIARTEGDHPRSASFFRQLVDLYAKHHFEFDLALASLDLAQVLAAQTRLQEAAEVLAELYPVLQQWELHGDILRAWLILQEGVRKKTVEAAAFRELAMVLRRKWHQR